MLKFKSLQELIDFLLKNIDKTKEYIYAVFYMKEFDRSSDEDLHSFTEFLNSDFEELKGLSYSLDGVIIVDNGTEMLELKTDEVFTFEKEKSEVYNLLYNIKTRNLKALGDSYLKLILKDESFIPKETRKYILPKFLV